MRDTTDITPEHEQAARLYLREAQRTRQLERVYHQRRTTRNREAYQQAYAVREDAYAKMRVHEDYRISSWEVLKEIGYEPIMHETI